MRTEKKKTAANNLFVIDLAMLENGPVVFKQDIPLPVLTNRLKHCEYKSIPEFANVRLELEPCGAGVLVSGKIVADIKTECGMCLADTSLHLTSKVSAYMLPKEEEKESSDDLEFSPEDLNREWFVGDRIVLDELILDALMLEMPMNPKCGSSCPGPHLGASFESGQKIDPRLAPLAKLKIEKEN